MARGSGRCHDGSILKLYADGYKTVDHIGFGNLEGSTNMERNLNMSQCGYAGKILRVNLTTGRSESFSSDIYLPEYIGGRSLATKIFWDEVGPGVGAYDPENKLIFASGPSGGTGIPTGGRSIMVGIAPNSFPEQFSYSSMGGWMGTVLKYAGYDALIIEGKASHPSYIFIDDDKIQILDATPIWGQTVSETERSILLAQGEGTFSMVIGPAGENLCRSANITTSRDHSFSKGGFGAVFGSKNLKAVAIRGSGKVCPADVEKVFQLRKDIGNPPRIPNPPVHKNVFDSVTFCFDSPPWVNGKLACSPGCTARCQRLMMGLRSSLTGEAMSLVEKCESPTALHADNDLSYVQNLYVQTEKNNPSVTSLRCWPAPKDTTDPDLDIVSLVYPGDKIDYYKPDFDRGVMALELCTEYGLDKYDMTAWYLSWIGMCKKEGLLDDLDFGMEPDAEDPAFVRHFIESIVYRRGIGDIFAEGMSRAIRKLGKEKYGDSIYHNRYNADGQQLDIPVSLESCWGSTSHWQGRGFNGCPKWMWVFNALSHMVNTRDAMSSGHPHITADEYRQIMEDGPSYSKLLVERVTWNECMSVLKDSLLTCEWQAPDLFYPTMEADIFNAATGLNLSMEELTEKSYRIKMLTRAILMRNFQRDRNMEVEAVYPFLTYPDPWGEVDTWDEWNDTVDLYYQHNGWDLATGWPYRAAWEKAGLSEVADEMERLGKLPVEHVGDYPRKPNPFSR